MSANNGIYINLKTNEAFYQACMDNGLDNAKLIVKGKNLEETINKARHWLNINDIYLEYGFTFI